MQEARDVLPYTHKKEYVTCMIPTVDGKGILSVGNDGFMHETAIVRNGNIIKLRSVLRRPVPLTGISHIWRAGLTDPSNSIVVGR